MEERHKVRVILLSIEVCHHRMHDSPSLSSSTPNEKDGRLTASECLLKEVDRSVRGESFDVLGRWEAFSSRESEKILEREIPLASRDLQSPTLAGIFVAESKGSSYLVSHTEDSDLVSV